MSAYYFVAASERFFTETDRLEEVFQERLYNYARVGKPIDFWLVKCPKFLQAANLKLMNTSIPAPTAAVISTDLQFIEFLKLRLEFVAKGTFEATSLNSSDILTSI